MTEFDFDTISTDAPRAEAVTLFDHTRDQHPPDAPEWKIHQAFVAEVTARLMTYKSVHFLVRYWFTHTHGLRAVAEADPLMFLDVLNHFQAQLESLTDIPKRESQAAAHADQSAAR